MPLDRYILPVLDASGERVEVELRDLTFGYEGIAVLDENGLYREIRSSPSEAPPGGELPVLDEDGLTQWLVAFEIAWIDGIYELAANDINTHAEQRIGQDLGLDVCYENAPFTIPEPLAGVTWAEVKIDWGDHEQVAFGDDAGRFHLNGDILINLYAPLNVGMSDLMGTAQSVIEAFRSQQLDYVRTYDSYHLPIQRDGSWWVCEIRTQFRAERDFDNP